MKKLALDTISYLLSNVCDRVEKAQERTVVCHVLFYEHYQYKYHGTFVHGIQEILNTFWNMLSTNEYLEGQEVHIEAEIFIKELKIYLY